MKKSRYMALLLSVALLLCFLSGCGSTGTPESDEGNPSETAALSEEEAENAASADEELLKAIDLGLVPEELQEDYEAQIHYREFCQILDNLLSSLRPEAFDKWKEASAGYRDADQPMTRMEGAIVMLYGAKISDFDTAGYDEAAFLDGKAAAGTDFFENVEWEFPLLPDAHAPYYHETFAGIDYENWRNELDDWNYARYFAEYTSYVSKKTYFDYDESYNLNLADAFTRGDAIRAALRFYETASFFTYEPVEQLTCTVSEETIALAEKMPAASFEELPDWRGYHFPITNEAVQSGKPLAYEREEVQVLKELGFNFLRVPLEFQYIFQGTDTSAANRGFLESMDNLIEYCAEADIHICFELHNMPGFTTDSNRDDDTLFWNPEEQELFADFWRLLAERYQNVPSNLLSFNLLNEPHPMTGEELTDELYSSVMLKAIEAIRESTPDRLIFADMLEYTKCVPVYGLADAQIVEAVHTYFLTDGTSQWPTYLINGAINIEGGTLQMKGSFPAGSEIEIGISNVQGNSDFTVFADGESIGEFHLGDEALWENGCQFIAEEGTENEWREYLNQYWTLTLPDYCSELEIRQEGGKWYQLSYINLSTGNWETQITANPEIVTDYQHPLLTFDETGAVTADKKERLIIQDREWMEEKIRSIADFREETKTLVMVQEFGYNFTIPSDTACAVAEDFLSLLDEYDIPWACWCDCMGPVISAQEHEWRITEVGETPREGATYEPFMENWLVQKELMEVFGRHMD